MIRSRVCKPKLKRRRHLGTRLEGKTNPRVSYGRSTAAGLWGNVSAKVSGAIGCVSARIDRKVIARVRRHMLVLEYRKRVWNIRAAAQI